MNSLNSIILEGNIVQEPVVRETAKGTKVCSFSVMCMRTYKQDETYEKEISFFDIDAWGKLAELSIKNATKGRGVRVVGRLKQSRWVDEHIEFKPVFKKPANGKDESGEEIAKEAAALKEPEYEEVSTF